MSMSAATHSSHLCLKRLLNEPRDNLLKWKRARLVPPPPSTSLSPCLGPTSPTPKDSPSQSPSRVGSYLLYGRSEREETFRAVHVHTKQQYTCQVLPLRCYQERLAAYAQIGNHDNVCGILDVVIGEESVYVFLPNHHGDMHAYVRSRKRLGEEEAGLLFQQMLNAVVHCHHHGVVLRDLKLRRFVFMDKFRTRVALLGLNDCVLLHGNHDDDSLSDRHGCPAYVGPELLTNGNTCYSGRAADMWSLGVSLYTMLIGRYPFQDTQPAALFAKIRRGAYSLPEWLSPRAKCVIGCMLRKSPTERLTGRELLMHPWLTSPRTHHHHATKTQHSHSSPAAPASFNQHDDSDDQVVPTWTENK
ncbi:tribbles homolog 2-like [Gouania willdenowi]|uniref:Tribbles homolog 2-like n=1 Tax=Gouania willdenowi TaxID=441366 RepID=A0A8C5DZ88_GOUWI|nr:tribbles homolog 2-like [Gouania willdenowi]